jgi:hypothetical protein
MGVGNVDGNEAHASPNCLHAVNATFFVDLAGKGRHERRKPATRRFCGVRMQSRSAVTIIPSASVAGLTQIPAPIGAVAA